MQQGQRVDLLENAAGVTQGGWSAYGGGRTQINAIGDFGLTPGNVTLQTKGPDPAATPIPIEFGVFNKPTSSVLDLAEGEYRAVTDQADMAGVYCVLVRIQP